MTLLQVGFMPRRQKKKGKKKSQTSANVENQNNPPSTILLRFLLVLHPLSLSFIASFSIFLVLAAIS